MSEESKNDELFKRVDRMLEESKSRPEKEEAQRRAMKTFAEAIQDRFRNSHFAIQVGGYLKKLETDRSEIEIEKRVTDVLAIFENERRERERSLFTFAYNYVLRMERVEEDFDCIASLVFQNSREYLQNLILEGTFDWKHPDFREKVDSAAEGFHLQKWTQLLKNYGIPLAEEGTYPRISKWAVYAVIIKQLKIDKHLEEMYPDLKQKEVAKLLKALAVSGLDPEEQTFTSLSKAIYQPKHSSEVYNEADRFLAHFGII